jgi:glycosyltransferase involved in cell wall biosynthesis
VPSVTIATFLPNVGVFGGVRRFLELGNAWSAAGHRVTLYHPGGGTPGWLSYGGRVAPLTAAASERSDLAVCADPHTYSAFRAHSAERHLYYCVLEKDSGVERASADPRVALAANSGPLRKHLAGRTRRPVIDGIGGINVVQFQPDPRQRQIDHLRVLVNGRRSRSKKGTDLILAALAPLVGRVPEFEIVLFDTPGPQDPDPREGAKLPGNARYVLGPTQNELVNLYQGADVVVVAERKAGWCNTAIEAMACGCAVACTPSGTTDFARDGRNALVVPVRSAWFLRRAARRLLHDAELRLELSLHGPETAREWSWDRVADKLLRGLTAAAA